VDLTHDEVARVLQHLRTSDFEYLHVAIGDVVLVASKSGQLNGLTSAPA